MDSTPTEPDDAVLAWFPLFPTGAYSHSLGFEECVRLELVRDELTLRNFLLEQIAPALEHFELPYLRFVSDAVLAHDFATVAELDAEIGAAKLAREIRLASLSLGARRLQALRSILPGEPRLAACGHAVAVGRLAGHHLTICAFQGVAAGMPLDATLAAYFYQSVAAVAVAALKLVRIGQDGVQRALRAAVAEAAGTVERSLLVTREEAGWFNPLLEIAAMRHERARERLFIS
jgi:urease accessory protein